MAVAGFPDETANTTLFTIDRRRRALSQWTRRPARLSAGLPAVIGDLQRDDRVAGRREQPRADREPSGPPAPPPPKPRPPAGGCAGAARGSRDPADPAEYSCRRMPARPHRTSRPPSLTPPSPKRGAAIVFASSSRIRPSLVPAAITSLPPCVNTSGPGDDRRRRVGERVLHRERLRIERDDAVRDDDDDRAVGRQREGADRAAGGLVLTTGFASPARSMA